MEDMEDKYQEYVDNVLWEVRKSVEKLVKILNSQEFDSYENQTTFGIGACINLLDSLREDERCTPEYEKKIDDVECHLKKTLRGYNEVNETVKSENKCERLLKVINILDKLAYSDLVAGVWKGLETYIAEDDRIKVAHRLVEGVIEIVGKGYFNLFRDFLRDFCLEYFPKGFRNGRDALLLCASMPPELLPKCSGKMKLKDYYDLLLKLGFVTEEEEASKTRERALDLLGKSYSNCYGDSFTNRKGSFEPLENLTQGDEMKEALVSDFPRFYKMMPAWFKERLCLATDHTQTGGQCG